MAWYHILAIVVSGLAVWMILSSLLYKAFFKRFYDFVLSGLAIVILSPLLLILTVVGAIAMKGNPFFTQKRPGKIKKKTGKEKIFKLIKFRTMTNEKDVDGKLLPDEKRLNGYGKLLRKTSLDELPELFNIFIGNMSIVGPRPQLIKDMVFMTDEQRRRHTALPGLTGLAQVSGRNAISWERKLATDLVYIEKISLRKDLIIIFKTVGKVLKGEGINEEGEATAMDFGDYLLQNGKIDKEEYDKKQTMAVEFQKKI